MKKPEDNAGEFKLGEKVRKNSNALEDVQKQDNKTEWTYIFDREYTWI